MGYFSPRTNALAWAHFRLRGGWRNTATTIGAYVAIIIGLLLVTLRAGLEKPSSVFYGWTMVMLALQAGALLLVAGSGVRSSVRRDIEGGMIESHRLMPMSGVPAVLGYLIGCTGQAMVGAVATFLIGAATTAGAGLNVFDWLVVNGILLLFAILCWISIALLSLISKSAFGLALVIAILGSVIGGIMPMMLPGLVLLCGPLLRQSVIGILERGLVWSPEYMLSFLAQIATGGLLFIAAARRFRRDDVPAFGTYLGSALVLTWALLNITGILAWEQICPAVVGRGMGNMWPNQIVCTTASTLLIALVPLSSSIWAECEWRRRRGLSDPALGFRPMPPNVVAIFCAITALLVPATTLPLRQFTWDNLTTIAISAAAALLALRYLIGTIYRWQRSAKWPIIGWILLSWFVPLIVDLAGSSFRIYDGRSQDFTFISAFGPIGVLIASIGEYRINVIPGLVVQCAATIGMLVLHRLATAKHPQLTVPQTA